MAEAAANAFLGGLGHAARMRPAAAGPGRYREPPHPASAAHQQLPYSMAAPTARSHCRERGSVRRSKPPGVRGDYPAGGSCCRRQPFRGEAGSGGGGSWAPRRGARGPGGGAAEAGRGGERFLRASRGRAAPAGAPAAQAGRLGASPAEPSAPPACSLPAGAAPGPLRGRA